jgi:DNA-binding IscR family transcriptional regulator
MRQVRDRTADVLDSTTFAMLVEQEDTLSKALAGVDFSI